MFDYYMLFAGFDFLVAYSQFWNLKLINYISIAF